MFKIYYKKCTGPMTFYLNKIKFFEKAAFGRLVLRWNSSEIHKNLSKWNEIKLKYSVQDLTKVLNVLNRFTVQEMKNYGISKQQMQIFETLQNRNLSYESLDDFVLLDVLPVPELEKICLKILKTEKKTKVRKSSIVSPVITKEKLKSIKTSVGLRLGSSHITWCQLELTGSKCKVLNWNSRNVQSLPINADYIEIIRMGKSIAECIPDAEAYIIEKEKSKPVAKINSSIYRVQLKQQKLASIVLTILSLRNQFKISKPLSNDNLLDSLYMMKPFISAQLFGIFYGNEAVSASDIVKKLLQNKMVSLKNITSITLNDEIWNKYKSTDIFEKNEMDKCFLVVLAFFELAIITP